MPEAIVKRLQADFGFTPVIATEIEFYLHGASASLNADDVVSTIASHCAGAGVRLACAEAERGPDQYEISLVPDRDISRIVADTAKAKALIHEVFAARSIKADFAAKPFPDAPGSGLHIHLHLEDAEGVNAFSRHGESFSLSLLHSIGGLLALMNASMPIFAPKPESYARFNAKPNRYLVCPTATNVPLTVSWGANNRTVAVRLPNKPLDNKHIEHRVAGSDADVGAVIHAILAGIHYGLTERCDPGPPIYGDASLGQYGLPRLAILQNVQEQHEAEHGILHSYF